MTRIAVIADIHGNLPALEAVLADVETQNVDELLVNGDLVGRGPQGSAVARRIAELGVSSTRGNHEDYLLSFRREQVPEDWLTAPEWRCSRWMAAELAECDVDYLDSLPFTLTSALEPGVRLFHGSPRSYNEGIGHWTEQGVLEEHLSSIDESVLVVAHTHRAGAWHLSDGLVVNVGSVGLPFNGDWRAQYAILEGSEDRFEVEFRQVPYDRERFLEIYRTSGFLGEGGATARLLELEVRTARPHVVPFLKYCERRQCVPVIAQLEGFLDFYDPELSLAELLELFEELD